MQVDAQLIRIERLKRAWSQEQLAQVSGLGLRTIQRIENGENASLETVKSLAAVLELPVEQLLVDTQQSTAPSTPSCYRLFKPWPAFAAGCLTTLIALGGLFVMQGASAKQVDMDFTVRLDNEEITRSRIVGEAGTPAVVEVSEVMRISITPTIMPDGTVFLETEFFRFIDGEFKLESKPKILTVNGKEAMIRIGSAQLVEGERIFEGLEIEITPMIE